MSTKTLRVGAWALAALLAGSLAAAADTYAVDPVHSDVQFKVRHFLTPVPGRFRQFDGTIQYDPAKPEASKVELTVQADSIDTANDKRDAHLKSPDFFEVAKFPTLRFVSKAVKKTGPQELEVTGDLTIHGVTREVTLPVQVLGTMKMPDGSEKAGFAAAFSIDRKDYGIVWNRVMDTGGAVLGDDVAIDITVEANQPSETSSK